MDSTQKQINKAINHCQVNGIKICTRCGSINIKIQDESITCNDCNAILCYQHQNNSSQKIL